MLKDIRYTTPSCLDAFNKQNELSKQEKKRFYINSYESNSRIDANGILIKQYTYEVYELIN